MDKPMARSAPLDIVIVYDFAHVNGGAAKVAINGAIGLKARGHRVRYFAPIGPVDPALTAAGVETTVLDHVNVAEDPNRLRAALRGLWNGPAASELRRLLADVDPENGIIYQHGWTKGLSPAAHRPIALSGLPSIHHLHEYFAVCPNGALYDYQAGRHCPLKPMSFACIRQNCDARSYLQKMYRVGRHGLLNGPGHFHQNLKNVFYVSDLQHKVTAPWLPDDVTAHQAPNLIDLEDLGPAPGPGLPLADAPFLFVGRLSREKGTDIAVQAAKQAGAPIKFVGDGPLADEIRKAAPDAEMIGWQDSAGVARAVRQARALVFSSIWYEIQPLAILEALANGLPVITTDTTAGADMVADGETGIHVKTGSVEALADAMRRLMDHETAIRMGKAAHQRYWANPHTLDRHLDAVEPALQSTVANWRR